MKFSWGGVGHSLPCALWDLPELMSWGGEALAAQDVMQHGQEAVEGLKDRPWGHMGPWSGKST